MENKKGLSTIVATLMIVLLVMVAIGIIWVVIRGVLETGAGQADLTAKCNLLDVKITANNSCTGTTCTLTVSRSAGGDDSGDFAPYYRIVAVNSTGSSAIGDSATTIRQLESRTESITVSPPLGGSAKTITITPVLKPVGKSPQVCTNTNEFKAG